MSGIDKRVVEMQFDNREFERGVGTSMNSINNLKKGLNFEGAVKNIDNLSKAIKNVSFDQMANNVQSISERFSAMGIAGMTVISNLTTSAVNFATKIVKALTIDPVKSGLEEYETKINAIQTILTNTKSKGTTLDQVNKALGELNHYADQTIYNFAEMTRNIGTFTAAGVDLNTSVKAIKGIANLAAGSGSSAEQASTAMYQLSQALAAGKVQLMDWNSVVNAGMGGELFQKKLMSIAKSYGLIHTKIVDGQEKVIVKTKTAGKQFKSFRESLESGWLTTKVLTKALNDFADDPSLIEAATKVKTFSQLWNTMKESVQSGWAVSWENIIGDKNQASESLTELNNAFNNLIGPSIDARNNMLKFWNTNGGRAAIIDAIKNSLSAIAAIIGPITKAFRDIFPPMTGKRLVEISKGIRDLTAHFKIGVETGAYLRRTFAGIFAILNIGKQALFAVVSGVASLLGAVLPAGKGIFWLTAYLGDFFVKMQQVIKKGDVFNKVMKALSSTVIFVADMIKTGVTSISNAFKYLSENDVGGIKAFSKQFASSFLDIDKSMAGARVVMEEVSTFFKKFVSVFKTAGSIIGTAFRKIGEGIDAISEADFNDTMVKVVQGGLFAAMLVGIKRVFSFLKSLTEGVKDVTGAIVNVLEGVQGCLEAWQQQLKAGTLLRIAGAIAVLAAGLYIISKIQPNRIVGSLAAIGAMMAGLMGTMTVLGNINYDSSMWDMIKMTVGMMALAVAINLLAIAMSNLAALSWNGIIKGITSVGILMGMLVMVDTAMGANEGDVAKKGFGFILFATALKILINAVKELGMLSLETLSKGLLSVGILLGTLALFLRNTDIDGMGFSKGAGILLLAVALRAMASAVNAFGTMNLDVIEQGLLTIAGLLTVLALFVRTAGNSKNMISTAIGIGILAGALYLLSDAIVMMGKLPLADFTVGLINMGLALAALAITFRKMPSDMLSKSIGMIAIAAALMMLTGVLKDMGSMGLAEIAKSLILLGGSLFIIAITMSKMKTALAGALTLVVVAGALMLLVPALKALGEMSLSEVGVALLALAGAFTILGLAAYLIGPLVPALLGLAASIALLGLAVMVAGAGVALFAAGLATLAASGLAGAYMLTAAITTLAGTIPVIFKEIAKGLVAFIKVIIENAPLINKLFTTALLSLLKAVETVIPKAVNTFYKLITAILDFLVKYIPKLVDTGLKLLTGLLKGIGDNIGKVIKTATDLIVTFLNAIGKAYPRIVDAGFKMVITLINGIAEALRGNSKPLSDALNNLWDAAIKSAITLIGGSITGFVDIGGDVVDGFINGMKGKIDEVSKWASNMAQSTLDAAKEVLGIHSPSRKFRDEVGAMIAQGTAEGIKKDKHRAKNEASQMAKEIFDSAKEWIDEKKYYNNLSLQEELYAYQEVLKKFKKGSEEYKQTAREIYRVKNEIAKDYLDKEKARIDELKYYNKMSLADELAAWKKIQAHYAKGREERKEADREVYRLEQEINQRRKDLEDDYYAKVKEINQKQVDDIKSLNDEYESAVKSRADSLYSAYGLFDKVEVKDPVNGDDLISNLEGQVVAFESWQSNINGLAAKGVSGDFIKELRDMGPSSAAQIQALNSMSSEQLSKYVSLWQKKHEEAKTQAVSELEDMRLQTVAKIEQLKIDTQNQLDQLMITFVQAYSALGTTSTQAVASSQTAMIELAKGTTEAVKKTVESGEEGIITATKTLMTKVVTTIKSEQPKWLAAGSYLVEGFVLGIKLNTSHAISAAVSMATSALAAAKEALDMHSPSRKTIEMGKFFVSGFAIGLDKFAHLSDSSAASVGNRAIDSITNAISGISDMISSGMDIDPTIKPVIDLTNVQSGVDAINGMLGKTQGISIDASVKRAASASTTKTDVASGAQVATQQQAPSISFTQNNYSPKALSRIDIYRQTKNQFSALKGLVNS